MRGCPEHAPDLPTSPSPQSPRFPSARIQVGLSIVGATEGTARAVGAGMAEAQRRSRRSAPREAQSSGTWASRRRLVPSSRSNTSQPLRKLGSIRCARAAGVSTCQTRQWAPRESVKCRSPNESPSRCRPVRQDAFPLRLCPGRWSSSSLTPSVIRRARVVSHALRPAPIHRAIPHANVRVQLHSPCLRRHGCRGRRVSGPSASRARRGVAACRERHRHWRGADPVAR